MLAVIAAGAYASWPLAFILNRSLAAATLASTLEARGQPFSWLFISLDCLTGVCTVGLAWLARAAGAASRAGSSVAVVAYGLFGLATALDALIPYRCGGADVASCGADLSHLTSDDLLTALAVLALFLASLLALADSVRATSWRLPNLAGAGGLLVWGGCGLVFFSAHFSSTPPVGLQHLFLTLSAGLVLLVPAVLWNTATTGRRALTDADPRPRRAAVANGSLPGETSGARDAEIPTASR